MRDEYSDNKAAESRNFLIDYVILPAEEEGERLSGTVSFEGEPVDQRRILQQIAKNEPGFSWGQVGSVEYRLFRVMSNDSKIVEGEGEISSAELKDAGLG